MKSFKAISKSLANNSSFVIQQLKNNLSDNHFFLCIDPIKQQLVHSLEEGNVINILNFKLA